MEAKFEFCTIGPFSTPAMVQKFNGPNKKITWYADSRSRDERNHVRNGVVSQNRNK